MKRLKRIIAAALTAAMAAGLMSMPVSAASFSDTAGHWAEATVGRMADAGIISGVGDNKFEPNRAVTRAEFATLINKAFGFSAKAIVDFSDVAADAWYADAIAIAVGAGYMNGYEDNTARPNVNIERQQAAVVASKVLRLSDGASTFTDMASIADYAVGAVRALADAGIITGRDGRFDPKASLTRAEAAVIVERMLGRDASTPTVVNPDDVTVTGTSLANTTVLGNLTITKSGTVVENVIVKGDLIVASSVGNGDVTLKQVTVEGDTYVRGGGSSSVECIDSVFGKVYVSYVNGKVRVVFDNTTAVEVIFTAEGKLVVKGDSSVPSVVIADNLKKNAEISIEGKVDKITLEAPVTLKLSANSEVELIHVTEKAEGARIDIAQGAKVAKVIADAKMSFTGAGAADLVVANADGITAVTLPKKTEGDYKITKVSASSGGAITAPPVGETPTTPGTPGIKVVSVMIVDGDGVELEDFILALGGTSKLVAKVTPGDAHDRIVTWSSNNKPVATIDADGNVTAVSAGTATITATAGGKSDTVKVTVPEAPPVTEGFAVSLDTNWLGMGFLTIIVRVTSDQEVEKVTIFGEEITYNAKDGFYAYVLKGVTSEESDEITSDTDAYIAELISSGKVTVDFIEVEAVNPIDEDATTAFKLFGGFLRVDLKLKAGMDRTQIQATANDVALSYADGTASFTNSLDITGVAVGETVEIVVNYMGVEYTYNCTVTNL